MTVTSKPTASIASLLLACSVALGCGGTAAAQDAAQQGEPPEAENTLVVRGMRNPEKVVDDFARDLTISSANTPMSFYEPGEFCPGVEGLSTKANREIARRMTQVANAAGMEPGNLADCQTSALVLFVDDTPATVERFRKLHPKYFLDLTGEEIKFYGMDTPIAGWKLNARVDRNGNPVAVNENGIQIVESFTGMSRLEANSRVVVAMSVLIVEKEAVQGLTTQQIADYAFMRSVTDTDPSDAAEGKAPTILAITNANMGDSTPLSLTAWDFEYVKARYSLKRFSYGKRQSSDIRGRMKRALRDARAKD